MPVDWDVDIPVQNPVLHSESPIYTNSNSRDKYEDAIIGTGRKLYLPHQCKCIWQKTGSVRCTEHLDSQQTQYMQPNTSRSLVSWTQNRNSAVQISRETILTLQCIAVFTVLLRNTCLNCSFQRQLGRLVTVSDPVTATSSLYRQSNSVHMDGVLLLYQAQLSPASAVVTLRDSGAVYKCTDYYYYYYYLEQPPWIPQRPNIIHWFV